MDTFIEEARKIGKEIGSLSNDTIFRYIVAEYKRLKLENEILKKELEKCEKNRNAKNDK